MRRKDTRTLQRAAAAEALAQAIVDAPPRPATPHGVAMMDQYLATAREMLDAHGMELDSPSDVATALATCCAVLRMAGDDHDAASVGTAFYGIVNALSRAFVESMGQEVSP